MGKNIVNYESVETLLTETKDRLHKLVDAEAIDILNEYKYAQKDLSDIKREIATKKQELERLKNEIEKHKVASARDMPREYIKKFVTEFTGDFAPGDTVYYIAEEYDSVKCSMCDGKRATKALLFNAKTMVKCPRCNGNGTVRACKYEIKRSKVREVSLKLFFGKDRVSAWNKENVYLAGREYAARVKDLFRNREDAEKKLTEMLRDEDGEEV